MRALHTAATGMKAQELNVQVISKTSPTCARRATSASVPNSRTCSTSTCAASARRPPIRAAMPAGIELGAGVKTVGTRA